MLFRSHTQNSNKNHKHQYCCSLYCEIARRHCLIEGQAARFGACQIALRWYEHPFTFDWRFGAVSAAASLWGFRSALACFELSFGPIASCAASIAEGLDILLAGQAGLGSLAHRGSLQWCGSNTIGAAWENTDTRETRGGRAVASAVPEMTCHELGTDVTAVDVNHSASGWVVREADTARAGRGGRVVTVVEHPVNARRACTAGAFPWVGTTWVVWPPSMFEVRVVLNSILFVESLLPWCAHDEGAGAGRRYGRAWRGADAVE